MQDWLTVKDFIFKFEIPESTLRGWIKKDRLTVSTQILDRRKTKVIYLDEKAKLAVSEYKNIAVNDASVEEVTASFSQRGTASQGFVQDAELVSDSPPLHNFDIVSNESIAVEKMIQTLKEFSDERAKTLEEVNKHAHDEIFELKAEIKQYLQEIEKLKSIVMEEKLKSAQFEAEVRIQQLKINELEKNVKIENNNFWKKARKL